MEKRVYKNSKIMWVLKALLAAYLLTGILLIVVTMLLYKFELSERIVSAAIVGIYVASTLLGGLILGKLMRVRKFLWGLSIGVMYFALLLLITLGVYRTLNGDGANLITTFLLCAGGGMIGGMIS